MDRRIEPARAEDMDAVFALLVDNGLPREGLRDHVATTLVAREGDRIVGSAALEMYPDAALLRSVAVSPPRQGAGLGRQLIEAALRMAEKRRAPAVYLLTTTADQYFPKFGFEPVARADVPPSIQTSIEFTSACPSTATAMRKRLSRAG